MDDFTPVQLQPVRELPAVLPGAWSAGDSGETILGEVQLRLYWRVISKHRRIIVAATVLAAILSVIFAFTRTPLFTAETQVRISTYQPVLAATKIEDLLHERSRETNYFETQIQEIKSRSLADKVLEDPSIRAAFEKKSRDVELSAFLSGKDESRRETQSSGNYKAQQRVLDTYSRSMEIEPVRRTSLVNIRVTLPDARMAAMVADRHAAAYIEWVRNARVGQQSQGLQFLQAQANEQRDRVADLERELSEYAEANSIVALNKDENITAQKLAQLNTLLTAAIAKRIEAENQYQKAIDASRAGEPAVEDGSTQAMRGELARLEGEYRQLSEKFTDSYPKMQQLKAQIEAVRGSIHGQQEQIVIGLKSRAEAAGLEEANLKEELDKQKSQAFDLGRKQVQYNVLNRELTASRELLENIMRQIKETAVSVEGSASNVTIVDASIVPTQPSYPRKKVIVMLGSLFGFAAGLGLAFLLNYLDNTVRTPDDVQALLQLPTLGVVPSFELEFKGKHPDDNIGADPIGGDPENLPALQSADGTLPVVFYREPKSLSSEAYRTIRTGLLLSQAGAPPRSMLFTSAQSSEGKTTTVLNIAASLASSSARVVVVDADLRRPSIEKALDSESHGAGLVEVLTGQRGLDEVIRRDIGRGLSVLSCGRVPPNPAELLGSKQMASLLETLSQQFDYVLIDSPPVLPVTDSMLLSRYVDGVVLVIKGKTTPRKVIRDARDRLLSVGARVLGVVLNDVDVHGGDYYYYNRYYYSYYDRDEKAAVGKV